MNKYINILDLDDMVFKELKKDPHIDNLQISSSDRVKIIKEISNTNSKFTYIEKEILSLFIGLKNFPKYSVISISKMLNLKIYQVRYYLNSAFYKIKRYNSKNKGSDILNFYNFDLNYDVFCNIPLTTLQYNVITLLFKYKVNPSDIEIYFFIPNLSTIILTLYRKYPNLIINKRRKLKMELNNNIKYRRTRSNRYILKDIDVKELLKFFDKLENTNILQIDILLTILEGQTKKAEMEKHPEFKNVCQYIDEFRNPKSNTLLTDANNNENTSLSKEVEESNIVTPINYSLENAITDRLFLIIKKDVKVKNKKRKKLFKLWKQNDEDSLRIILKELDDIISKKVSK